MSKQKIIVPLDKKAGYLEANRLVKARGGKLPSAILHDDYLVRTDRWRDIKSIYPAWEREILAHPEKGGEFRKGKDIVDSETGWTVPWSEIIKFFSADELTGPKKALFIDPEDFSEEKKKIIVYPASIILVNGMVRESGNGGRVDEATRLPIEVESEVWKKLSPEEKRWIFLINGVGVRPLVRGYGCDDFNNRLDVLAVHGPDEDFGVASEIPEGDAEKFKASTTIEIYGVSTPELRGLISRFSEDLEKLSKEAKQELLEAGKKLEAILKGAELKE